MATRVEKLYEFTELSEQLKAFIDEHPTVAPELAAYLSTLVVQATYPELVEVVEPDEDAPEDRDADIHALACPYCGHSESFYVVDTAERWTTVEGDDVDHEAKTYSPSYDSGTDFEGYYLKCPACMGPVNTPNGWEEN